MPDTQSPNFLTEIAIILDRSGSMGSIARDMEGGLRAFIEEQKKVEGGTAIVSLYHFDHQFETRFEEVPLDDNFAADLSLKPRGDTALLDAVARAIGRIDERHGTAAAVGKRAPDATVVIVITDGEENAPHEVDRAQVRALIETHSAERDGRPGWQFAYLSADANAFADAGALGVVRTSSMRWDANAHGAHSLMASTSKSVASYRSSRSAGNLAAQLDMSNVVADAAINAVDVPTGLPIVGKKNA